ncbi:MAG TPA: hypothetical protein VK488_05620 [Gaiellaceae bacterium]|nr:hypothetical protein [Gaiellaceae bacterium]
MRLLRAFALALCVLTLGLAASGCGGGGKTYSGTKPDVWAATVCGALGTWAQGLKDSGSKLSKDLSGERDLKVVKAKFVTFLEDAKQSSGTMVAMIKGAGPPAVKEGAAIQQQLLSGFGKAQTSFARAIKRAKKLSTSDPRAFSAGVQALGGDVQKELTAVGTKFNSLGSKYKDQTLNKATAQVASCAKIGA